jgi:hypothetical protein
MIRIWDVLEIPPGSDRDAIRRAYAKKLRATHPEDDPDGFKRLREAYEAALEQHDHAARWAEYEESGADEEEDEEGGADAAVGVAPRDWSAQTLSAEPRDPAQAAAEPEIEAMLAARESELAALHAAMADLEAGLRGPWRPADAVLEERLDAILASPALAEIRVRSDIEPWLADLLAATIPHSDAVLLQSIQAFGWGNDDQHLRGTGYAVSLVLGRLDEWRIIEGLNHHSHAYHPAWRSLTRPPGAWWSWRLDAFRPGMIDGVETLLGEHGEVAPGLHHSFKAESVERWRRFLARPRLTLGMLALMPLAFLALLWLGYVVAGTGVVGEAWMIAGGAAIGFATPAAMLFTLGRWRQRWRAGYDHPRWQREGWLAAYALLAFATMAIPRPDWPALVLLPATAIAAWAYVTAPRAEPRSLQFGGGTWVCIVVSFFGLAALDRLDSAEGLALGTVAALLIYFRIGVWSAIRMVLDGLTWRHREWIILGGTVAGLGMAFGIWWLRALGQSVMPLYIFALAAAALLPLIGSLDRGGGGPPRWIARALLVLALAWAFGATVPPAKRSSSDSSNVPFASAQVDADMAGMETDITGFSRVRQGNPALHAAIRAVMVRYRNDEITRGEANNAIAALVTAALRQKLPDAQTGPLVEWLRIRMDRLEALRKTAPALCVSGTTAMDGPELPERIRQRASAQTYDIVASEPASAEELAAGRPIGGAVLVQRASAALHISPGTLIERLDGKRGDVVACDARIALTQALLDSDRQDDIAATLRQEFRRVRDEKAVPGPSPKKAGDRKMQSPA